MKKIIAENKVKLIVTSIVTLIPGLLGWKIALEAFGLLAAHWICLLLFFADQRNREGQSKKAVSLVFWLMPCISLLTGGIVSVLQQDATSFDRMGTVLSFGFGLLFLLIGNYMPKIRQNWVMGIRVKWTMENEENWSVTHRFGGKVWVAAGLVCMIGSLLPTEAMAVIFPVTIIAAAVIPCFYSYLYYKKQLKAGTAVRVKSSPRKKAVTAAITVALAVFLVWVLFAGSMNVVFEEDALTIKTGYWSNLTVPYEEIETVSYQPGGTAPDAGVRTYGFGNLRMLLGSFANDAYGNYTRYTYTSCDDCIVLSVEGDTVVFNGADTASTEALYDELTQKLGE